MPAVTRTRANRAITSAAKAAPPRLVASAQASSANGRRQVKPAEKSMIIDSRAAVEESAARKRRKVETKTEEKQASVISSQQPMTTSDGPTHHYRPSTLPVEPKFSVQAAMDHLTGFDPRFKGLFSAMKCRPFVEPFQAVDPFRTLATSIVGQQVSWMAAKAINNRFRGLFGYTAEDDEGFPSPADVVAKDVLVLKSAGLSLRKAEYVKSLAEHFLSGQLSTELLRDGTDEEITKALIAVRGIGQWTVDMFLIFSLRRPNILPYTDLGVQKGLLRFALTAHDAFPESKTKGKFQLSKKKTDKEARDKAVKDRVNGAGQGELETIIESERARTPPPRPKVELPPTPYTPGNGSEVPVTKRGVLHTPNSPGGPTMPPTPLSPGPQEVLQVQEQELPEPAPEDLLKPTRDATWDAHRIAPLNEGLTIEVMRSRWSGKKAKGGAYLTPAEMDRLTEGWTPYRSLGVYYTWAIADGGEA